MMENIKSTCKRNINSNLYVALAAKIEDDDGVIVPKLLQCMLSIEEAEIALEMPGTAVFIADKLAREANAVNTIINSIVRKGAAFVNEKTNVATFLSQVVQIADYGMGTPNFDHERGDVFFELMRELRSSQEYLQGFGESLLREAENGAIFRVVPRWDSIKDIPGVMPCESMKEIGRAHV